jgi:hypothetical protein
LRSVGFVRFNYWDYFVHCWSSNGRGGVIKERRRDAQTNKEKHTRRSLIYIGDL